MTPLTIVKRDATSPQATGPKIIAHVCNDIGGWGAGFVVAISKRCKQPEADYRAWHRNRAGNDFGLGVGRHGQLGAEPSRATYRDGFRPSGDRCDA